MVVFVVVAVTVGALVDYSYRRATEARRARLEAEALASRIDDNRGRIKWLGLKREIADLTKALQGRG